MSFYLAVNTFLLIRYLSYDIINKVVNLNSVKNALYVVNKLIRNGYQAYFVGGCVRDYLLKLPSNDIDITTSATPYEVMRLFKAKLTGEKYGTVTILDERVNIEVTTFRTEEGYHDFRRPDKVVFTTDVKEDVTRRDFTINALLMDEKMTVYDYVGGRDDLNKGLINAVGDPKERFKEDSLRLLRAVYFQAKLGFKIGEETFINMKENASLITHLPNERVLDELFKILSHEHQLMALKTLKETNLNNYLPGLKKGIDYIVSNITFPLFIDAFFALSFTLNKTVPRAWKFSNFHFNKYQKTVELALKNTIIDELVIYQYGLEISLLANKVLFILKKQDNEKRKIEALFHNLKIKSVTDLEIKGSDILALTSKKQGAWLKKLLAELVELVILNKIANNKDDLLNYAREKLNEE
jgi:tRNA nucleotidyltransferase (CCA-adding enzyme)